MPIYEYHCTACGAQHEALQKINDQPLTECPECHKPKLQKQISAAGFRLSGQGWYETDFKKDKRKNVSKGDTDSGAHAGAATSTGTSAGASASTAAPAETSAASCSGSAASCGHCKE